MSRWLANHEQRICKAVKPMTSKGSSNQQRTISMSRTPPRVPVCQQTPISSRHLLADTYHHEPMTGKPWAKDLQKWAKCYLLIWQFCTLWKIAFFGVFKENFFLFTFFNAQEKRSKNPVYFLLFKNQQQGNKKGTPTRKARRKPSRKALKSFILLYIVFIIIYLFISHFLRFVTYWFSKGLIYF